jgi:flavin reductase (DIM6/NTAB) family NADH-FMN oxidoreductase RutF
MKLHRDNLKGYDPYKLIMSTVVPRPIAWISTTNENGTTNLAPYSNFTFLCYRALMVGVGMGRKAENPDIMKDTERNIRRTGEFVINIPSVQHLDAVHESSKEYSYGTSELDMLKLNSVLADHVNVQRLTDVGLSLECSVDQILNIGPKEIQYHFVTAFIKMFHIDDQLIDSNERIDTQQLDPLMRIGGPNYASIGETFFKGYLTAGYVNK